MAKQKIEFITDNRKELISLESLLAKTLPKLGFERKGSYPILARIPLKDSSTDFYIDSKGNEVIYNYRLERGGIYSALIDATKAGAGVYSSIFELVSTSFPNLVKRKVGA